MDPRLGPLFLRLPTFDVRAGCLFLFLVLALGAALLVAVDSEPRPAFAISLAYQLTQGFLVAIMKAEADIHISIHGV